MNKKNSSINAELQLVKEVKSLSKEVKNLKELEFIKVFKHPFKLMWFSFLKGLMVGFGSVLGASLLVALFVYTISQIKLVPILGDFINSVLVEIDPNSKFIDTNMAPNNKNNSDFDLNTNS